MVMMRNFSTRLRYTLAALTLALLLPATLMAQTASQPAAPTAFLPYTSFDFGTVYKGEIISHIFVIKNLGNADLVIESLSTTCGCTVAHADAIIPPGQEGKAILEINTATSIGESAKTAILNTNDAQHPRINLTLYVNVLAGATGGAVENVTLRPGKYIGPLFVGPQAEWGETVLTGQTVTKEFFVSVERGSVKLLRVEDAERIRARIETIEEGKRYKLIVENAPIDQPTLCIETLKVFTDSDVLPYFLFGVHLQIRQPKGAVPAPNSKPKPAAAEKKP